MLNFYAFSRKGEKTILENMNKGNYSTKFNESWFIGDAHKSPLIISTKNHRILCPTVVLRQSFFLLNFTPLRS